jgi:subtilase family serine protease
MRKPITSHFTGHRSVAPFALSVCALLALAGCGGGSGGTEAAQAAPAATTSASVSIEAVAMPADVASAVALPTFHLAPVLLPEPSDADAADNTASALAAPHVQAISGEMAALGTQRLTVQAIQEGARAQALAAPRVLADGSIAPAAATTSATTYTPAQIRAAYVLPALPSAGAAPTALQAAQQGAGQTIYIIDAMSDPNVAAELAAFNTKFGLPTCTTLAIAATSALPLASASTTAGCTLSVVYSTDSGTMTTAAPAYDSGWATEIALDVQWVHATAPRARIVLIEASDASQNGLLGAVELANATGAGVVSMSFGAPEGNWTAQVDSAFTVTGMTYVAATGDNGSGVSWPAVSSNVLAVGGTSLTYNGASVRSESAWADGGGGISAYTATPAYQSNKVPGMGVLAHRAVADVSFNADPYTGQYVTVLSPGSSTPSWVSAGGTSLSTPQWAALMAVANALRVQAAKPLLGAPHTDLYAQISTVPGTYAAAFADIVTGADGSCSTCAAKIGYDIPTGLGTPNATALLSALGAASTSTAAPAPVAPVVATATVSGKVGTALSYAVGVTGGTASSFSLAGAPSGMTISNAGILGWAKPVAGTYSVTVTAANASTGLTGRGVLTVVIAPVTPPVITAPAITGTAGKPLSGSITVASPSGSALTVQITGVPMGVSFSASGQKLTLSWPSPVAGKYSLAITAKDASGLTTSATLSITVSAR